MTQLFTAQLLEQSVYTAVTWTCHHRDLLFICLPLFRYCVGIRFSKWWLQTNGHTGSTGCTGVFAPSITFLTAGDRGKRTEE
jgi:hypothetical protein